MPADGTIKYSLQEPFEDSVDLIHASLRNHHLRVVGEIDVSMRLERSLRMMLGPCRLIFVLPVPAALTSQSIHPWAAVFLPLHIVIWGNDRQSEIGVANMLQTGGPAGKAPLLAPIVEAQRALIEAIEAVAVRPGVFL